MSDSLATTDRLGLHTWYYRTDGQGFADSIRKLLQEPPTPTKELDAVGVQEYLQRRPSGCRSCFRAVRPVPAGCRLVEDAGGYQVCDSCPPALSECSLASALENAIEGILADNRPTALALSGGLDSAVLLGLVLRAAGRIVPVYTLAPAMSGYCELAQTQETARALGLSGLRVVEVGESDFVEALPDAIAAAEVPLFNLHPVSKLLLARALKADGVDVLFTGDAADQVVGTSDGRDYLPIVGALFRKAGIDWKTPFAHEKVVAAAESLDKDPEKTALREVSRTWLPEVCVLRPKRPTYAPMMDLSRYEQPQLTRRLAEEIGVPWPSLSNDRERTLWTTLGLLVQQTRGEA